MGWLFLKSRDICSSPQPPRPKCSSTQPKCSSPRPKCSSPRPMTETRFMIKIYRIGIQMSMLRPAIPWTVQISFKRTLKHFETKL